MTFDEELADILHTSLKVWPLQGAQQLGSIQLTLEVNLNPESQKLIVSVHIDVEGSRKFAIRALPSIEFLMESIQAQLQLRIEQKRALLQAELDKLK